MNNKLTDDRLVKILSETQATINEHNRRQVRGSVEVDARLFEGLLIELQQLRKQNQLLREDNELRIADNKLYRVAFENADAELQGRRKASSEPYGFTDGDRRGMVYEPRHAERLKDPCPLYRNPPAPVVLPEQHWEELCRQNPDMSIGDAIIRAAWWNHCRTAMLQGQSEPAPKPSGMSGIVPDYEGVALTQRECYMAGKKAGLDEASSSSETPDGYVVEKLAEGDE